MNVKSILCIISCYITILLLAYLLLVVNLLFRRNSTCLSSTPFYLKHWLNSQFHVNFSFIIPGTMISASLLVETNFHVVSPPLASYAKPSLTSSTSSRLSSSLARVGRRSVTHASSCSISQPSDAPSHIQHPSLPPLQSSFPTDGRPQPPTVTSHHHIPVRGTARAVHRGIFSASTRRPRVLPICSRTKIALTTDRPGNLERTATRS